MNSHFFKALEFGRSIVAPGLDTLIVFVTSRCNCRCNHCFYWRELNNQAELTLSEIESISLTSGRIRSLMLSGGEPFIRNDLSEIADLFVSNAKVHTFSIPTNGTLSKNIITQVKNMCQRFRSTLFKINVSLDAFDEVHDRMRGCKGIFNQAVDTIKELICLRSGTSNLEINVTTVICHENLNQVDEFVPFVQNLNVDQHNIEIIRGEAKDPSLNRKREDLINGFIDLCWRVNANTNSKKGVISEGSILSLQRVIDFFQRASRFHQAWLKSEYLRHKKAWGVRCRAGENICVIEPNGDLRACELRHPVCNLRDFNFDLNRALANKMFSDERDRIKDERCSCTHGCFLSVSCRLSATEALIRAPIAYLKWRPYGFRKCDYSLP